MRKRKFKTRLQIWFSRHSNQHLVFGVVRVVLYVVVSAAVVWCVLHLPLVSVRSVRVSTESDVGRESRALILSYTERILNERRYGIQGAARYLFNKEAVERMIEDRFLNVGEVQIESEFFNRWVVSAYKRETFGTYCAGNACLLVDDGGTAFSRAGIGLGHRLFVRSGLSLGERVFGDDSDAARDFSKLSEILLFLEQNGLFSDSVSLNRDSRVTHVQLTNGVGIWLDLSERLYAITRALHVVFVEVFSDDHQSQIVSVDVRDPLNILYEKQ